MKSQFTVVANSRKVRVICMPPEALEYLSEPVRRQTRHKILDLFIPIDKKETDEPDQKRPLPKPESKKDSNSDENKVNDSPVPFEEISENHSKSSKTNPSETQKSKAEASNNDITSK